MNLRKTVRKSRLIQSGIILFALVCILAVYPARLIRERVSVTPPAGMPVYKSELLNTAGVIRQAFFASYDRIDSIDIYVSELVAGRYMKIDILDEREVYRIERVIDLGEEELPGFVRIPLGMQATVGERYRLTVRNHFSSYYVGYEGAGDQDEWLDGASYNWEHKPGLNLHMAITYDLPLGKGKSLLLMGGIALLALFLSYVTGRYFKAHPEKDSLYVSGSAVRVAGEAVCILFYGTLFFLNFPLRRFDARPLAYLFYALGIVLSALLTLLAIRRVTADVPVTGKKEEPLRPRHLAVTCLLALAIHYCVMYVNGVSDTIHAYYQQRQIACLAGVILLTLPFSHPVKRLSALPKRLSPYAYLTLVTGLALVLTRNTRTWVITLFVVFLLLYYSVAPLVKDGVWERIFYHAVELHFVASMGYCLLFRAFQAFQQIRYGMMFHTVTVTGEYLAMITVTGFAAFVYRMRQGKPSWKELLLFGTAVSYLIFTMSRIAFVSVGAALLIVLLLGTLRTKEAQEKGKGAAGYLRRFATRGLAALLAVVVIFPAAFTMQRILPAIAGRHVMLEGPEEQATSPRILGSPRWDSPYYVNPERFFKVFYARVLGGEELPYFYPEETSNYDEEGRQRYDDNGNSILEILIRLEQEAAAAQNAPDDASGAPQEAAPAQESAESAIEPPEAPADIAYEMSNGRTGIWEEYMQNLNLTGHTLMQPEGSSTVHAHNTYLQTAFDHGLIVGILFLIWIGVTIMEGARRHLVVFGAALAFAFESIGEWTFHLSNPAAMIFLLAIVPLFIRKEKAASPEEAGQ